MTTETNTPESFDDAFAEVVAAMSAEAAPAADTPPAATTPAADTPPAATTPAAETPPAATTPAAETPPAATTPAADTPPAATTPAAETPPAPAKPAAPVSRAETAEEKAAREEFEASIAPYTPTPEETAAMEQFKKDFPNEAVAIEARLKAVDRDMNARIHKAVQNLFTHMEGRMAPVEQTVTEAAFEQHRTALHTAHPDYDEVIAKVPAWIKTLPSYAQTGAQAVYDGGTTQEVIALVADYKKAAGIAPPPAPAPTPAAAPAKPTPAGADDLTPVGSRRTTVTPRGAPDPNDFEGAFKEIAATLQ